MHPAIKNITFETSGPKTLNGFPVIRIENHRNCSTVMVEKPGELVVATWWPELKETWMGGHYFRGTDAHDTGALRDFNQTSERNARR